MGLEFGACVRGQRESGVMTGGPRDIPTILTDRMTIVQAIATENSEILRLNQIASGMMILDQMNEADGAGDGHRTEEWGATDAALDRCRTRIDTLEAQLAELDRELEEVTRGNAK